MSKTTISWTEETWNPTRGCSRISPGCTHCYAERMASRGLPGHNSPTTGEPFAIMKSDGPHWTGKVELIPHMLDVPLRRRKPTMFFVNSMSDLFHDGLSGEHIDRVFAAMALCPQHTFQVLTKRADRMRNWTTNDGNEDDETMRNRMDEAAARYFDACHANMNPPERWPLPNVWLGVSVEDRDRRDRIEHLRHTPAAVRFLSLEPLLEDLGTLDLCGIDWVIVGGESGPGARPCDIAWVRSIVEQCRDAGVKCFVKQLGAKPEEVVTSPIDGYQWNRAVVLKDRKGGDWLEFPEDLRVRQMPEAPR